jgi:hypothetical protein
MAEILIDTIQRPLLAKLLPALLLGASTAARTENFGG